MNRRDSERLRLSHRGVIFLSAGLLMATVAWSNLWLSSGLGEISPFWWTNGALAALLLLNRRNRWPTILGAAIAGELCAHILLHQQLSLLLMETASDVLESWTAAYLIQRIVTPSPTEIGFRRLIVLFLGGALIPALSSGLLMAFHHQWQMGAGFVPYLLRWLPPSVLGLLITVPLLVGLFEVRLPHTFRWSKVGQRAMMLVAVGIVACAVFSVERYPLLFLLFPLLLLTAVYLEFAGAAIGVCIVGVVGAWFTLKGRGPLMLIPGLAPADRLADRLLVLQAYLAATIFSVAVLALVLAERSRLERLTIESEARYRLITQHSRDILIMGLLDGTRTYVSPACEELLGWTAEEFLACTFEDIGHPDDLPVMRSQMEAIARGQVAKEICYRLRRKDGSYTWLEANLSPYADVHTGAIVGFVNVSRAIAKRKAAEQDLQNAYQALEALATVDGLTGVANRRRFDEGLTQEWRRSIRTRLPVSLVLLDVDHFKSYNDLYGHVRGDSCLKQIAEAALDVVGRPADLVARFGGEEFALVLPNTDEQGAFDIAEQLRVAVEQRGLQHEGNGPCIVTVSAGCATMIPQRGCAAMMLVEAADRALYAAKRGGRNRVETAVTPGSELVPASIE